MSTDALDWYEQAACRDLDPDRFDYDPEVDPPAKAEAAKGVCASCAVRDACLEFALERSAAEDTTGIYGGLTPAERATRRPPERPQWRWRRHDPEFAARSFAKATELGTNAAARFYRVHPKTLRAAWDQHGLGDPNPVHRRSRPRPPSWTATRPSRRLRWPVSPASPRPPAGSG